MIGLSETKYKVSEEVLGNNNISGYSFVSQPTLSNVGGTGFSVSNKLTLTLRDDLSESNISEICRRMRVFCH